MSRSQTPRLVLQSQLAYWRRWWTTRQDRSGIRELVPAILAAIPDDAGPPPPSMWVVQRIGWTETGVALVSLGPPRSLMRVVVRLPRTTHGLASLDRQERALAVLCADPKLVDWR